MPLSTACPELDFAAAMIALADSVGAAVASLDPPGAPNDAPTDDVRGDASVRAGDTVAVLHERVGCFVLAADGIGLDARETRLATRGVLALARRGRPSVPRARDAVWLRVEALVVGLTTARLHLVA